MVFRLVPKSSTLDDLQRPITHSIADKMRLLEATAQIWMKIDPNCLRQKCRPMTLVSGNIRYMRIFVGVSLGKGVKWGRGCGCQFLAITSNWSGWMKWTNSQFSRWYIFVRFRNNVDFVVHYDNYLFWISSGFLLTPISMALNDLECPIRLKVRFADGTLDNVCCSFQRWPCVIEWAWPLNVSVKSFQGTVVSDKIRLYEFSPGFNCTIGNEPEWSS